MATKKLPYARAVLKLADGGQVSIPVWEKSHCRPTGDAALARVATDYASPYESFAALEGQLIRQRDSRVLGTWSVPRAA
jgi:hypothetical protein